MSISGFDNAIKDQVSHYSDTLGALRDSEMLQRNNALAGIQSQVEKFNEIAKLGLEFPVAIEGLKAVGGTVKRGVNWARGVSESEGLGNIKNLLSGGEAGNEARGAISTALSGFKSKVASGVTGTAEQLQSRFDNLRTGGGDALSRASSGVTKTFGEYAGESKSNSIIDLGRNAIVEPTQTGRNPGEAGRRRTANRARQSQDEAKSNLAEDMENSERPGVNRMGSLQGGEESSTSMRMPLDETGNGVSTGESKVGEVAVDDFGLPKLAPQSIEMTSPPVNPMSNNTSGKSFGEFRSHADHGGGVEMEDRSVPTPGQYPPQQPSQYKTGMDTDYQFEPDDGTSPIRKMGTSGGAESDVGSLTRSSGTQAQIGSLDDDLGAPARPTSKAPGRTDYDDALDGTGEEPDISPTEDVGDSVAKAAGEEAGGEARGAVEEGLGAGLLASGIFAPLGALLEGVGALTEVASVGAGVYGAARGMIDAGKEDALRDTPLPQIKAPPLDLGGSVGVPLLA